MDNYFCFVLTILLEVDSTILRVAIKLKRDMLPEECGEYPMAQDARTILCALLPPHVRSLGPIVEVTPIFEVVDST